MKSLDEMNARVSEIESRQDEALRMLDELERRVDQLLAEYLPMTSAPQAGPAAHDASFVAVKAA